ncbi:MAG: undecaprenyldiphospho-muramoylpentapeptide beta-N-acetylglucosaminyltransferase [Candidatus Eisenbacteria bacterium]|nr:undecaprenyldiphospho-muramoylpentapeptide beta-N-acetylglucosaminyltransferase [Candidatus Eisenbacteria bacterium]
MKILITGGGTGGHLYPALAVADALKPKLGADNILFVGSNRGMESREVPEAGYGFRGLESVGFPRKPSPQLFKAMSAGVKAVRVARTILGEFAPDVVFSTGGYASAPVVFASWLARIPIVLHEQNSVPGRANRFASRKAERVFLGFSSARRFFPRRDHLRLSGNPLREQVVNGSRPRAIRQFRLEEGRKTVLVLGGSQGAHSINQAMVDALGYFGEREDVQFLIQSGQRDHEWMVERCREQPAKSWVRRFIPNMGDAYAVADLVVARAGAMTISELEACGLPSVLVPYPHAMDNHQLLNADQLREGGAAIVIEDRFLSGKDLHDQIVTLLEDHVELRKMSMNARRLARPDATEEIARALLGFGGAVDLAAAEDEREDRGRSGRGPDRGRRERPGGPRTGPGGGRDGRPDGRSDQRQDGRRGRSDSAGRDGGRPSGRRTQEGGGGERRDRGRRGGANAGEARPNGRQTESAVSAAAEVDSGAGEAAAVVTTPGAEGAPATSSRNSGASRRRRRRRGSGESRARSAGASNGGEGSGGGARGGSGDGGSPGNGGKSGATEGES